MWGNKKCVCVQVQHYFTQAFQGCWITRWLLQGKKQNKTLHPGWLSTETLSTAAPVPSPSLSTRVVVNLVRVAYNWGKANTWTDTGRQHAGEGALRGLRGCRCLLWMGLATRGAEVEWIVLMCLFYREMNTEVNVHLPISVMFPVDVLLCELLSYGWSPFMVSIWIHESS